MLKQSINMSTNPINQQPAPGDYYGTVYKGGFLLPLLLIGVLIVVLWLFLRKRR